MSLYVIDCSIWISALLHGGLPQKAVEVALLEGVAISQPIYDEIVEVLGRPKFKELRPDQAILRLEALLVDVMWVEPRETVTDCVDTDDNKYLECALAADASAILTGDKRHLLPMHPWRGISILQPSEFLAPAASGSAAT